MEVIQEGRIFLVSEVDAPLFGNLAPEIARIADELWSLLWQQDPVEAPTIFFHDDPELGTTTIVMDDVVAILLDLASLVEGAIDMTPDVDFSARMLRYAESSLAEELFHAWELLRGIFPDDVIEVSGPLQSKEELVVYYAQDHEFRALEFVVDATGQREELLAEVQIYRAENGYVWLEADAQRVTLASSF